MVDYWDRTHLARMRASRPHSQDSDGSMILHFAIEEWQGAPPRDPTENIETWAMPRVV